MFLEFDDEQLKVFCKCMTDFICLFAGLEDDRTAVAWLPDNEIL